MYSTKWKEVAELVGIAAIVVSLVFVALELRQNTAVSTAQAVGNLNISIDASYRARAQDSALDQLVEAGHSSFQTLSERERSQYFAWLRADMNLIEAAWFYFDRGIIPASDFDGYKEASCSRITTPGGREFWSSESIFYASRFREAVQGWCFK
jgi:hypothetical protein